MRRSFARLAIKLTDGRVSLTVYHVAVPSPARALSTNTAKSGAHTVLALGCAVPSRGLAPAPPLRPMAVLLRCGLFPRTLAGRRQWSQPEPRRAPVLPWRRCSCVDRASAPAALLRSAYTPGECCISLARTVRPPASRAARRRARSSQRPIVACPQELAPPVCGSPRRTCMRHNAREEVGVAPTWIGGEDHDRLLRQRRF